MFLKDIRRASAAIVLLPWIVLAPSAALASELCFFRSLGYVADCGGDGSIVVGAEGFSTPDAEPCPETLAPGTWFTISASNTNPHVRVAELPPGQTSLYLWCTFDYLYGWTALFCTMVGDIPILGFESPYKHDFTLNPEGTAAGLYLAPLCGEAPLTAPIGEFLIRAPTAVEDESWGQIKALYR